jgi:hypothetical protein
MDDKRSYRTLDPRIHLFDKPTNAMVRRLIALRMQEDGGGSF